MEPLPTHTSTSKSCAQPKKTKYHIPFPTRPSDDNPDALPTHAYSANLMPKMSTSPMKTTYPTYLDLASIRHPEKRLSKPFHRRDTTPGSDAQTKSGAKYTNREDC